MGEAVEGRLRLCFLALLKFCAFYATPQSIMLGTMHFHINLTCHMPVVVIKYSDYKGVVGLNCEALPGSGVANSFKTVKNDAISFNYVPHLQNHAHILLCWHYA